jgi:hypothetical protein
MRGLMKALLIAAALAAVAEACGRVENPTAPARGQHPGADLAPLPGTDGLAPQDTPPPPPPDTTGRWGGGLGSGT